MIPMAPHAYTLNEVQGMVKPVRLSSDMISKVIQKIANGNNDDKYILNNGNIQKYNGIYSRTNSSQQKKIVKLSDNSEIDVIDKTIVVYKKFKGGKQQIIFRKIWKEDDNQRDLYSVYDDKGNFQYAIIGTDKNNSHYVGVYNHNGREILGNSEGVVTEKENRDNKLCIYFSHFDEKKEQENERNNFCETCLEKYEHQIHVDLRTIEHPESNQAGYSSICGNAVNSFSNNDDAQILDVYIDDHGCEIKNPVSGDITDYQCSKARMKEIVDTISSVVGKTPNLNKICIHNLCCHGTTKGKDNIDLKEYIQTSPLCAKLANNNISLYISHAQKEDIVMAKTNVITAMPSGNHSKVVFKNTEIETEHPMLHQSFNPSTKTWTNCNVKNISNSEDYVKSAKKTKSAAPHNSNNNNNSKTPPSNNKISSLNKVANKNNDNLFDKKTNIDFGKYNLRVRNDLDNKKKLKDNKKDSHNDHDSVNTNNSIKTHKNVDHTDDIGNNNTNNDNTDINNKTPDKNNNTKNTTNGNDQTVNSSKKSSISSSVIFMIILIIVVTTAIATYFVVNSNKNQNPTNNNVLLNTNNISNNSTTSLTT